MDKTNYENLLPKAILFNLKEIEKLSIIKIAMAKKLIQNNEIEFVKIGNKIHISRAELINYLNKNTQMVKTEE